MCDFTHYRKSNIEHLKEIEIEYTRVATAPPNIGGNSTHYFNWGIASEPKNGLRCTYSGTDKDESIWYPLGVPNRPKVTPAMRGRWLELSNKLVKFGWMRGGNFISSDWSDEEKAKLKPTERWWTFRDFINMPNHHHWVFYAKIEDYPIKEWIGICYFREFFYLSWILGKPIFSPRYYK